MRLLLLICIIISCSAHAQYWGRATESLFVNEAMDIETDAAGNSYVTGYITGQTNFSASNSFANAPGNGDIFVAKYASNGLLQWVRKFGGSFSDRAYDLALDASGNVYITGQFFGTVNFDGNSITSVSGSKDIFLAKLDNSGTAIWAIAEGGTGPENAYGITIDAGGNCILTGQYQGNSTIAGQNFVSMTDPGTGLPSYDLFISKYDPAGNALWVQTGVAKYDDRGLAVTTDASNNIYLSGQFSDTLLLAGQTFYYNSANIGLVARFSPTGTLNWFNTLRAGFSLPYDLEVRGSNLFIAGDCKGNLFYSNNGSTVVTPTAYDNTIYVVKTALSGQHVWTSVIGSDNNVSAKSISVDGAQGSFVTGSFNCALTELHAPETGFYNSVGYQDCYLWRVKPDGTLDFVRTFGGKSDDIGYGVALLPGSAPLICGTYTKDLNVPYNYNPGYEVDNSNVFNFNTPTEPAHLYLTGDLSRNSFITNAVHSTTPKLNYFTGFPSDSTLHTILPNSDTVHFCLSGTLNVNDGIFDHYGPVYEYLWSTNSTSEQINVFNTGNYWVTVEREDGCSEGTDTTYVIIHQLPDLPTMSDNLGLAVNEPGPSYYSYHFCYPDSVQIWFNDLDPDYTIQINSGAATYNDTLPHYYQANGNVIVSDDYCTSVGDFSIQFDYPSTYDYEPYLVLLDEVDFNDTISICMGSDVSVQNLDSTNNPFGDFYLFPDDTAFTLIWTVTLNNTEIYSGSGPYYLTLTPSESGDYIYQLQATMGYDNLCGTDTTTYYITDTFHIEVLDVPVAPVIPINGPTSMCPGEPIYLTVDTTFSSYDWLGPDIDWISPGGDSILVGGIGAYAYGGTYVDTLTGCSTSYFSNQNITTTDPPMLQANPADGIICPNDSVTMSVPNSYASYEWTGPSGTETTNSNVHTDAEVGFYYVTVTDFSGCVLTSNPIELNEFTIPYLYVDPGNIMCSGEMIDIEAVVFGDGTFQWLNPQGLTTAHITVNQPGWYVCEMHQCGITVLDSVELIDGSFDLIITADDSSLCQDQTATISATPGLSQYEWSDGINTTSQFTTSTPGSYWLTAYNSYGCEENSDTITIVSLPQNNLTLTPDSLLLCPYEDLQLTPDQSYPTVTWEINSSQVSAPVLNMDAGTFGDGYVYVSAIDAEGCATTEDSILLTVIQGSLDVHTTANLNCAGDSVLLWPEGSGTFTSWSTPFGTSTDSLLTVVIGPNTDGTYVAQTTDSAGCVYVSSYDLDYHPLPVIYLPYDTILCLNEDIVVFNVPSNYAVYWNNSTTPSESFVVTTDGVVEVMVVDQTTGCVYYRAIQVDAVNCDDELPNVFTPNGDGVNDFFIIDDALALPGNYLIILNRWGEVVYDQRGYKNTFMGNDLVEGVYFYIFYPDYDAEPERRKHGFLHLVR